MNSSINTSPLSLLLMDDSLVCVFCSWECLESIFWDEPDVGDDCIVCIMVY